MVCAWTPCVASTRRSAPSHAASDRETSKAKPRGPGVDEVEEVPAVRAGAVVEQGHGLGFDGDAARALDGEAVEVLFAAAGRDRAGELHEAVGEGGFAVVDVRDDGEGADVLEGDGEVLVGGTLRGENLAIRERCRRAGLGRVRGAGRRAGRGREGARRREGKDAVPTREGRRRGKRAERRGARAPRRARRDDARVTETTTWTGGLAARRGLVRQEGGKGGSGAETTISLARVHKRKVC